MQHTSRPHVFRLSSFSLFPLQSLHKIRHDGRDLNLLRADRFAAAAADAGCAQLHTAIIVAMTFPSNCGGVLFDVMAPVPWLLLFFAGGFGVLLTAVSKPLFQKMELRWSEA